MALTVRSRALKLALVELQELLDQGQEFHSAVWDVIQVYRVDKMTLIYAYPDEEEEE